jgi:hypothetical protein
MGATGFNGKALVIGEPLLKGDTCEIAGLAPSVAVACHARLKPCICLSFLDFWKVKWWEFIEWKSLEKARMFQ